MTRILKLLLLYVRRQFLQWMAWRAFLFTLVINQAVSPLIGLAVWSSASPGSKEVSTYYVVLLAVQLMTVSYENHTFANGIYAGSLSNDLLRPQPVVLSALGANIAMRVWHLLVGVPLVAIAATFSAVAVKSEQVTQAVPALALAAVLRFLFTYILALSAFWTQQANAVVGFGATLIFLLGGVAAPIPLMPEPIRPWAAALPFRAMLGFPVEIASGNLTGLQVLEGYGWQIAWLAVLLVSAVGMWDAGVRRYTAVGG